MSIELGILIASGVGTALVMLYGLAAVKRDSEEILIKYAELLGEARTAFATPDEEETKSIKAEDAIETPGVLPDPDKLAAEMAEGFATD